MKTFQNPLSIHCKSTDLKLQGPFRMIVVGPSMCGKTTLIKECLMNQEKVFIQPKFDVVYLIFTEDQKDYSEIQDSCGLDVQLIKGFEKGVELIQSLEADGRHKLIILDDCYEKLFSNEDVVKLFTRISHHRMVSVIALVQNLKAKTRHSVVIDRNCDILVTFYSYKDNGHMMRLGMDMNPQNPMELMEVYKTATQCQPYSYLVIDNRPTTNDLLRHRSSLFVESPSMKIVIPKSMLRDSEKYKYAS